MAELAAAHLSLTRSSSGVWTMAPIAGRNYESPVTVEPVQTEYGAVLRNLDFAGVKGASQRFRATVSIYNFNGTDGMDGRLQALFDETGVSGSFMFQWPMPLGAFPSASEAVATGAASGAAGSKTLNATFSEAPKVGALIRVGHANSVVKLYRVAAVAGRRISLASPLIAAESAGVATGTNVVTKARFVEKPLLTTTRSQTLAATIVVQETLE